MKSRRRPVLSVIGSAGALTPDVEAASVALGRLAVDAGFRIASGGRDGVMEAASRGAHASERYREGDVVAILPTYRREEANAYADIVIPTGLGVARNALVVAIADVVVAVHGGSGTLSELALAWQLGKPVVALRQTGGWAEELAGRTLDARRADQVIVADSAAEAVEQALACLDEERENPCAALDPM